MDQRQRQNMYYDESVKWKLVNKMYPEISNLIDEKVTPRITDISIISTYYRNFTRLYPSTEDPTMDKILFISVILKLYCPRVLHIHTLSAKKCVIKEIAKLMGYNSNVSVSHLVSQAKAYMKISTFANRVEEVRKEVVG